MRSARNNNICDGVGFSMATLLVACLFQLMVDCAVLSAGGKQRTQRFIYNSDANHMYYYKEPPMSVEDLQGYVDEVAGTGVTTFFASPNWGMLMSYPTEVTEMIGSQLTKEELDEYRKVGKEKAVSVERAFTNFYGFINQGQDPFRIMLDRAREQKMEVFITYRPNEIHDVQNPDSLIVTKFWKDHPEYRVGKIGDEILAVFKEIIGGSKDHRVHPIVASWFPGALNFAIPEVQDQRLAELRECCERYDIDGIDLDFQRFPIYFPQDEGPQHVETMTAWMRKVRKMTREVGEKRGRPILVSARIMARPEQNLAIGLDPRTWAEENLIDFVTVSHYLRNDFPLPVEEYRKQLPEELPIYASIEVEKQADRYREIARDLYDKGVDGLMMFNYFTRREGGQEPDFSLFKELSDPTAIQPVAP